jgi:hypothetical protein
MKAALCLTALLLSITIANAATVPAGFTDTLVANGLTNPTVVK